MPSRISTFITGHCAPAKNDITVLGLFFGLFCLAFNSIFPLLSPDEGRYSEIPREMLEKMDFITPTLNYVKYFEKPPLLYWMNALSFALFGENEFAARLPCALAGLLTILFTYWLGRELFNRRTGIIAALIIGTSTGFIPLARINLTDMPVTLFLTLCLGSYILAVHNTGSRQTAYYYLTYGSAALAVLTKGLIGILFPGTVIFLFMLCQKRWDLLKEMRLFTGITLFCLMAVPWFILVSIKNPEFARFFFIHEHFERFLTRVHGRYQPIWYFVPILLGVMLPWSLLIPTAFKKAWQERNAEKGDIRAWLAIWALFIFAFFSKSNSKLIPYILPVIPPIAILIAVYLDHAIEKGQSRLGKTIAITCGVTLFISLVASFFVYSNLSKKKTSKPLDLMVRKLANKDDIVASFGYNQTLPFYARRRTVVVGSKGELEFGSKQGDQSEWFIDREKFMSLWSSDKKVYLILGVKELEATGANWVPAPVVIARSTREALVSNR